VKPAELRQQAKILRDAAGILLLRARRQTLLLTIIVRFLELAANAADREADQLGAREVSSGVRGS
jgi:hypothetical protein